MSRCYFILVCLFLTLHTLVYCQATEPSGTLSKTVAIFPCKPGNKVTITEASYITDRLTLETIKQGVYSIIDRFEIDKRLAPSSLRTYDTDTANSSYFSIGEACRAAFFVLGIVSRNGTNTHLELQLGDVGSHRMINNVSIESAGSTLEIADSIAPLLLSLFNLTISKDGHKTVYTHVLPPKPSSLIIHTVPSGARVTVGNEVVGETPLTIDSIMVGRHSLVLELKGYSRFSDYLTLESGSDLKILVNLHRLHGALSVRSSPSSAKVSLSNGMKGKTPFTCDTIKPGSYTLDVSLDAHVPDSQTVLVRSGKHDTLNFTLVPQRYVDSIKQVNRKQNQWVRRILFGGLSAGFLGFGLYQNIEAQRSIDKQNEAYDTYSSLNDQNTPDEFDNAFARYTRQKNESEKHCSSRNVLYTLGGISSVGFGLSIRF